MGIILSIWSRLDEPLITHRRLWNAGYRVVEGAVVGLVVGLVVNDVTVVLRELLELIHWVGTASGCSLRAFIVSFKCFP